MSTQIDLDEEKALRPITLREKAAIYILLVVFRMVYPSKFEHQMKQALAPLFELLEKR